MNIDDYRKLRLADPFHPFVVRLQDGRAFLVERPELSMQSKSGRYIYVALRSGAFERIELASVADISVTKDKPKRRRRAS